MEIERRDFAFEDDNELVVESRADGRAAIVGYAAVYNRLSLDLGGFKEEILPGAFDKILGRQRGKGDVVALFNHDSNIVLGRTSSGTLELSSDEKGLRYVVTPPVSRADVLELIQRRDVRGSSFAFTVDPKHESFRTFGRLTAIKSEGHGKGIVRVCRHKLLDLDALPGRLVQTDGPTFRPHASNAAGAVSQPTIFVVVKYLILSRHDGTEPFFSGGHGRARQRSS